MDCCNTVLAGAPMTVTDKLQLLPQVGTWHGRMSIHCDKYLYFTDSVFPKNQSTNHSIACTAHMRPIATNGVAWSVCVMVTTVNTAKTDEPIDMMFVGRLA